MDSKEVDEVANTYLLNVLEIDLPEDLDQMWQEGFNTQNEWAEADELLQQIRQSNETDILLRLAVETTLQEHPETEDMFVQAVEDAGKSMFVVEVAIVSLAAVLIMREYYRRGIKEEKITEWQDAEGNKYRQVEREYLEDNITVANLMAKIATSVGLGA